MSESLLHFISLNVRGLRNRLKRNKIFLWLKNQKCDIAFLQETFWLENIEQSVKMDWKGQCFFDHGTNHSKGVAILVREGLSLNLLSAHCKRDGRAIIIRFSCHSKSYFCINIYAPAKNTEKEHFYKSLDSWVKACKPGNDIIIAGGDWNCVQNRRLDTHGISNVYLPKKNFKSFQAKHKIIDIWRKCNQDKKQFTWRQLLLKVHSRLDYWLISRNCLGSVFSTDIRPALKCDHNAISLKMKTSQEKRGKGFWKMNNSLLKDDIYVQNVKNLIQKVKLETRIMNKQMRWEVCKYKIKEYSVSYAREKQSRTKRYYMKIEKELKQLYEMLHEDISDENIEKIDKLKQELDKWYTIKCKGAYIRSREKWLEEGEKCTKYFIQLEKQRGNKKEIHFVERKGKQIVNNDEILKEIHKFYKNLYCQSAYETDIDEYLRHVHVPSISEEEAESCEGMLTEAECWKVLSTMKLNRSPGSDGLSVEFYRFFWNETKDMVINSLNEGYTKGELSFTQRQSIVTLLYKKGNKGSLDNWRPISLLNIDYKITARVLAMRLQKTLSSVISADQCGFIKGRTANENARLVQDVIDYCKYKSLDGIILFLDFQKAFDNVNHSFLFETLKRMNFKKSFTSWIQMLYKNAHGRVIQCGWLSEKFYIHKGVRQGCPLSALLFILVVEILAIRIKENKEIKGINITANFLYLPDREVKITQYADDTTIFVNSLKSVDHVMNEIDRFGKIAGPKVNWNKTKMLKIMDINSGISEFDFTEEPVKFLGVFVGKNEEHVRRLNWEGKIEKVNNILKTWKMRRLTCYGKIIIIKCLIIPQIVYVATVVPMPEYICKGLHKTIYSFLWNSKREKVKRNICIKPEVEGGLGMVDLYAKSKSLKLSWLYKFFNVDNAMWKTLFSFWMSHLGEIPYCFHFNCHPKHMIDLCRKKKLPIFYTDLLCTWAELRYIDKLVVKNVYNEILWNNSNIVINKRPLHFHEWKEAGIMQVKHVIHKGKWKDASSYSDSFDINNLLFSFKLAKLRKAFPKCWLEKLSISNDQYKDLFDPEEIEISVGKCINVTSTKARNYYLLLLEKKEVNFFTLKFWQGLLDLSESFVWKDILDFKLKKIKDNRIKQFNFKLFHRILASRDNLYKWKIEISNQCETCNEIETIHHFLYYCKKVQVYWKIISKMIYFMFEEDIVINMKMLIIGYRMKNPKFDLINLMINFAQFTVYNHYIKYNLKKLQHNNKRLIVEFISSFKTYLKRIGIKQFNVREVKKIIDML